ncbi:SGNH/GDSL hydrolase family protein [Streptomyces sp. 6N223]|uniref:SGNH/GDSL hydrolase family protein n=1 Tax=Streptomyces sp. 6N223 TaxID=3457412 RepID=UPI003FCF51DB
MRRSRTWWRRATVPALAALAALAALCLFQPAAAQGAQGAQGADADRPLQEPVRIMPLGDSITGSPGCWRALLWQDLVDAGYAGIDFVGTLAGQGCGFAYDGENEGHGGILATNMADQNQLPAWLSATNPDVVLMHLGTNDVWSARSTDTILAAYTTLVEQMRAHNPRMEILVAQIIPMDSAQSCATCAEGVVDLNAAIPDWAASLSTEASPVTVVDQWTGFDTATDTYDGVHPNDAGNRKIADAWYPSLTEALSD